MNWTSKHIEDLKRKGNIRGYQVHGKGFSAGKKVVRKNNNSSKALQWLELNLQYWSNEKALTMEKEHKFCERGWRFDFAWPSIKLALEFEGGIFLAKSGHNTARHYTKDSEKYNRAVVLGWRVIRVTAMNYSTALTQLGELVK